MSTDRFDLTQRAAGLSKRLDLPRATEIRWATDMTARWGSCTPTTGAIRISDRLAAFPDWVVDYVIVHELAHLVVPGHDAHFWQLVHRFSSSERAIGYLIAKSGDDE
jgi:predicted metal-dependent hydrolase